MASDFPEEAKDWFARVDESLWLQPDDIALQGGEEIAEKFQVGPESRVLDCPCGRGLVSLPLARRGARVTGWDRSELFIEQARARFASEGRTGDFHVGDMRQVHMPGGCDLLINWFGSFGYFTDEENKELMRRFAGCLRPGGRLLLDNPNPNRAGGFVLSKVMEDGRTEKHSMDPALKRINHVFTRPDGGEPVLTSMRLYSADEMRDLLEYAGLTCEALYAEHFQPFVEGCERLLVVGRRP